MTFDYKRACSELAMPEFNNLPLEIKALYARVVSECKSQHQNKELGMDWPLTGPSELPELKEAFNSIDVESLALASRAVHFAGHWGYKEDDTFIGLHDGGSHWKFSLFADQTLRRKLGMPEFGSDSKHGISYAVHEGAIRVCYSTPHSWTWREVIQATPQGLRQVIDAVNHSSLHGDDLIDYLVDTLRPKFGPWANFFNTEKYHLPSV